MVHIISITQSLRSKALACSLLVACRLGQDISLDSTGTHVKKQRSLEEGCLYCAVGMCAQSLCMRIQGRGNSAPEWFAGMQKAAVGFWA